MGDTESVPESVINLCWPQNSLDNNLYSVTHGMSSCPFGQQSTVFPLLSFSDRNLL